MTLRQNKINGRSAEGRRLREIKRALLADLGREPKAAEVLLIDEAASTKLELELLSQSAIKGAPHDPALRARKVNSLVRIVTALKRGRAPTVGDGETLQDYARRKAAEAAA